jgi:hypothetical protein
MVFKSIIGASCACLAVVSLNANASLVGVLPATPGGTDYQAYYDDVAELTWLANANVNGPMNWIDANNWAASLDVAGVTGWRLPDTLQPDDSCDSSNSWSYNCTGSEMGNLYYNVLGNTAGTISNTGPFSNVHMGPYWSATEYEPDYTAWVFGMHSGYQYYLDEAYGYAVWAVRSGDVRVVPVPAAAWLFGSGLLGLIGAARRKA